MARDIAKLSIRVESDADKAAASLNVLEKSGKSVEVQTKKTTDAVNKQRDAQGRFVKKEKEAADALNKTSAATKKVGDESNSARPKVDALGDELDEAAQKGRAGKEGLEGFGRGARTAGEASMVSTNNLRMLGFQLNQVGQQGMVTGNYMQALAIQLPDILGVMGSVPLIFAGVGVGMLAPMVLELLKADDAADDFLEKVEGIASALDRVDSYDFSDTLSGMSADAESIKGQFDAILSVAREVAAQGLQSELQAAKDAFGLGDALGGFQRRSNVAGQLGDIDFDFAGYTDPERARQAFEIINMISGKTREEMAASLEMATRYLRGSGLLTEEMKERLTILSEQIGLEGIITDEIKEQTSAEEDSADAMMKKAAAARDAREAAEGRLAQAREESAELQGQAEIQRLIAIHGKDAEIIAQARLMAEREAYAETLARLPITEDERDAMQETWDAANGIAGAGMAANISAAVAQAIDLANNMGSAAISAAKIEAFNKASAAANSDWRNRAGGRGAPDPNYRGASTDPNGYTGPSDFAGSMTDEERKQLNAMMRGETYSEAIAPGRGGGKGGGGGKSEAAKAADDAAREAKRIDEERKREALKWYEEVRTATQKYNDELKDLEELNKLGYFKDHPEAYAKAVAQIGEAWQEAEFGDAMAEISEMNSEIAQQIAQANSLGEAWEGVISVIENKFRSLGATAIETGLDILTSGIFPTSPGEGGSGWLGALLGGASKGGGGLSPSPIEMTTYEGGGSTGSGPRVGGVDGRGGKFAIIHPDETVTDHRKGGGSPGGSEVSVDVRVYVDDDGNLQAMVRNIADNASKSQLKAYDKNQPLRVRQIQGDKRRV